MEKPLPPEAPTQPTQPPAQSPAGPVDEDVLRESIVSALKSCFDPEIPVNIYELGLIYQIQIDPEGQVRILMTLTSPACPAAGSLPPEVQMKASVIPGVKSVQVEVVWDPPWTPERMSEAAKLQLGLF